MRSKIAAVMVVSALVIAFQNCGKAKDSSVVSTGSSAASGGSSAASVNGNNELTNSLNQKLQFYGFSNDVFVAVVKGSPDSNPLVLQVFNATTARYASVKINRDKVNGQFLSVEKVNKPYMCYDPTKDFCATVTIPAGFAGAGTQTFNCSSPLFYAGAINGSVDSIVRPANELYCK